jgi:uncharacterized protein with NRDE domain
MCLIVFDWRSQPRYSLVVAANRDERHDRPAAPLQAWQDIPGIVAGRDLSAGGTWLGVHRSGRFAAVTNVREPGRPGGARSRGELTVAFLRSADSAEAFAQALSARASEYGGYNLLLGDGRALVFASNRPEPHWQYVEPGLHGLSNASLDTPWPKLARAGAALRRWRDGGYADPAPMLRAMRDAEAAPDAALPDTGVGTALERSLSSPFICLDGYGTRCTTLLRVAADGRTELFERRFDAAGETVGERSETLPPLS